MASSTKLRAATEADRPALASYWQLYQHDLTQFRGTVPDGTGRFKEGRFPTYFADPDRCAYVIVHGDVRAGFAFLIGVANGPVRVGDFFVLRSLRRLGVGAAATRELFTLHRGDWEIAFQENNPGAPEFWRGVAEAAAPGRWREERRPVPGKLVPHDNWLIFSV
jgi:predicted acetyltransferase